MAVAHQHKIGHLVPYVKIQLLGYVPLSPMANTTVVPSDCPYEPLKLSFINKL